ncbi:MAG: hypothetical protein GTN78_25505, partial [Gemmatimonadales bacterium]|nr:hypothetical protein [Gemmatimonadales bacterium]NIN12405.1 hypothetical protein [Gemmatimonadales bacterium]NIR03513.1 hypothetical protein [Gemmatimonadales bacterium]NIS67115.1 hypothetical protein [Gemmatimonadales bacterium]
MQLVPSLADAKGGGFVSEWNGQLLFPPGGNAWFPVDGALGTHHSGVVSTDDGTCTDHNEGFAPDLSVPLTANNECEATLGSASLATFGRLITLDNWVAHWDTLVDKSQFSWDFWRQPETSYTEDFLGDFQTYGIFSDWTQDRLADFGSLIPGGSGDPGPQGWPLGLTIKFDAYTFQLPTVDNAFYWRALVINDSEQVYGVGLDYDSLYIGLIPEPLHGQGTAGYYRPDLGTLFHVENGIHPNCNGALIYDGVSGCGTTGFDRGAYSLIFLKSPIGDLRNKLFTRRADGTPCEVDVDPFCDPDHPNAGDTITFNHG